MTDDRLKRIEDKVDKVLEAQNTMNVVQVSQAQDLRYHIKRTDLLEAQVATIQKHVYMGLGIAAVLAVIAKALL